MSKVNVAAVHRILMRRFKTHRAPITRLSETQRTDPFRVLTATILSSRTKDETTAAAAERLFAKVRAPEDLARLSLRSIEKLIFPVGFFHTKARHLRKLPKILKKEFNNRIPDTVDDLCKLPGVGRKTANLVVSVAFDKPAICVDVHVHRISNRLGLVKTSTPKETELALRRILPRRYWKTWNRILVHHGQTVCRPRCPLCNDCPISTYCSRIGV